MLDRVVVGFPNEEIIFSAVPAGATTDYQPVQHGVYDNVAYQVTINDKFIEQPVIDWVGAEPLPGTSFTFVLSIRPPSGLEEAPSGLVIETEVRQD